MSFLRHKEIYRSDVSPATAGSGNSWSPPRRSSAAMSFQSAIPWRVALRQSLPPLHRLVTILNNPLCRTMIFQRTATTPLTSCLSPRVHSTSFCRRLIPPRQFTRHTLRLPSNGIRELCGQALRGGIAPSGVNCFPRDSLPADLRFTLGAPRRPQAPFTGANTAGSAFEK